MDSESKRKYGELEKGRDREKGSRRWRDRWKESVLIQGTLVPKLTLGPFLTLSVKNGHKLKD